MGVLEGYRVLDLGEHTREILAELGLNSRQVDDLLAAGVVAAEQQ